jgi:hypothetical protein
VTARVRVAALRVAAVLVLALGALATCAPVARAAGTNHALVVVEANGSVVQRVVTFGSDSISGLTALQQAGFAPVVRGFGGMGGAVCAIDMPTTGQTVGCPADNTCLTCAGSSFWAYFEAPSGTSSFRQSRAGASTTRVHDGDVEGWRWGTGDAPPYTSVASVIGPPPTAAPATPPPAAAPLAGTTAPRPLASGTGPAGPPPPSAPAVTPTTTTATPSSSTPHAAVDARRTARRAAKAPAGNGSGSGSTLGYVVFGVVAAALGTAIVLARRARRA